MVKAQFQTVTVTAPARLHMGFIDLSGGLGRHFGSIGVALNEINTRLSVSLADELTVSGPGAERARRCVGRFCEYAGVPDRLHIEIAAAIPEHIGLGSARKWRWRSVPQLTGFTAWACRSARLRNCPIAARAPASALEFLRKVASSSTAAAGPIPRHRR
ncbi:hypothetical protein [Methylomonas koyamae]|uniref:hypothetical protein n=1 Tax=Methylomonas koyamae TaxID=702114 RepID=UPI00278C7100|nr:hypothetical protein [Methylomonas koyamae]